MIWQAHQVMSHELEEGAEESSSACNTKRKNVQDRLCSESEWSQSWSVHAKLKLPTKYY